MMKIMSSVSSLYQDQYKLSGLLKNEVDSLIEGKKKPSWFYKSRLKEIESFALKLETGRYKDPAQLEDFFACMIVVENYQQIQSAYDLIEENFKLIERKPESNKFTHKNPDSFPFDDLRIYCSLKQDPRLPSRIYDKSVFEIQIKTFLQHAWSIATHDLIYKSDTISWSRQRVAYQAKAILEQVEMSISGINHLVDIPELDKTNRTIKKLITIREHVTSRWDMEELPSDINRLVSNISSLSIEFKIKIDEIFKLLDKETQIGKGIKTKDLSPFTIIVQSIFNQNAVLITAQLGEKVNRGDRVGFKLFLPKELDTKLNEIEERRAIVIK